MKKKLLSIIIWSMIAAAFIGPGTLTTASAAGAGYGYTLIWALLFATIACMVIQEASARISIVNEDELPVVLTEKYSGTSGLPMRILLGGSVIFGCAAYQAGNILGAVSGIELLFPVPVKWGVTILVAIVAVLLYLGSFKSFGTVLSIMVGIMGISFLVIVTTSSHSISEVAVSFIPSIPKGGEWLVLGLIGTTIVPYNLFLGSGISKGQSLPVMRLGLVVSIGLGGLISMAILITGSLIEGEFSFQSLSATMISTLGSWAQYLLAFGLFAAGFTSSVTAPLGAALISRGFFGKNNPKRAYHMGWALVLLSGFVIGLLDFKPIPVIILAQGLNGFILPVIVVFLMIMVNDHRVLASDKNTLIQNILFGIVLVVIVAIGLNNLLTALGNILPIGDSKIWWIGVLTLLITGFTLLVVKKVRA